MVPVIIGVKVLQEIGGIEILGKLLSPIMQLVGLPGSMGLVWATTMATNIYTGMVAFASLSAIEPVTVAQTTVLVCLMLVAHNLPVELRIAQKAGTRLPFMFLLRTGGALIFGWILFRIYQWGGWLQQPNVIKWMPQTADPSLFAWATAQVRQLAMIFLIIMALLLLLKTLQRIGLTTIMVRFLTPVLRLMGIGPSASTITIVGMTLGLAYGGGLIIHEAASGRIEKKDVLFSLTLMAFSHSLIEDTILVAILGGDLSGILWGRVIFSMLAVYLLVKLISGLSERVREILFLRPASE